MQNNAPYDNLINEFKNKVDKLNFQYQDISVKLEEKKKELGEKQKEISSIETILNEITHVKETEVLLQEKEFKSQDKIFTSYKEKFNVLVQGFTLGLESLDKHILDTNKYKDILQTLINKNIENEKLHLDILQERQKVVSELYKLESQKRMEIENLIKLKADINLNITGLNEVKNSSVLLYNKLQNKINEVTNLKESVNTAYEGLDKKVNSAFNKIDMKLNSIEEYEFELKSLIKKIKISEVANVII